ncbi:DegV family protein [Candidatus Phytoplasma australiense]|uniref:DegV Family Protein n=1 Tax=Strawberry lethal yellows phytoplasma (CPA) str. NZSb11 TaxID=980422 RepID=R4RNJ3_PHYAS|nr:DegV family protein [Candidatus Phytoplasma australiense]AGL90026.1 degV Family Protein [Strawberry lethal yellows phytoplasma (CPA) str. NZSb11]
MKKRKLGIIVDSTCGSDYGKSFFPDISVVPLTIIVDGKSYVDGDFDNKTLLHFIDQKKKVTTSQPNPELFIQAFKKQFSLGYEHVFCFTLSHKLSGTFNSALLAKKILNDERITIIDSETVGPGVIFALKRLSYLLEQETFDSYQALEFQLKQELDQGFLLFYIENLKQLVKNGRISKFKALIGTLFKIHPIVKYQKSVLMINKKIRNFNRCFEYLIQSVLNEKTINNALDIQTVHVDEDSQTKAFLQKINDLNESQITVSDYGSISSVVAVHMGSKAFGFYLNTIKA